jgi:hypothetical protein
MSFHAQKFMIPVLLVAALQVSTASSQEAESAAPESTEKSVPAPSRSGPRQVDRLELDTTSVTGNQELPKVLYIVPWKESGIVDLAGKPVNSLMDEVLEPLDREVFQRQVRYFDQLHSEAESPVADGQ